MGKTYTFVRSTLALEICPNIIIYKIGWWIILPVYWLEEKNKVIDIGSPQKCAVGSIK